MCTFYEHYKSRVDVWKDAPQKICHNRIIYSAVDPFLMFIFYRWLIIGLFEVEGWGFCRRKTYACLLNKCDVCEKTNISILCLFAKFTYYIF